MVQSRLSMFFHVIGPLTSDLTIGRVLKSHKGSYLYLFTDVFAAHTI